MRPAPTRHKPASLPLNSSVAAGVRCGSHHADRLLADRIRFWGLGNLKELRLGSAGHSSIASRTAVEIAGSLTAPISSTDRLYMAHVHTVTAGMGYHPAFA